MATHPVYRSLLHLYPPTFRSHYGNDLIQNFEDLVADRGIRKAWTRGLIDLAVTIPRYRLERIMSDRNSATTISIAITLLVIGAAGSVLTGIYPGVLFILGPVVLAIAQRSTLSRAIRTPDSDRRRRRLTTAAVLALVSVVTYTIYLQVIGDHWTLRETILVSIGTPAMIGAPIFFIMGLLTPRTPEGQARFGSVA